MKKFLFIMILSTALFAQNFVVQNVTGKVYVQKGVNEELVPVNKGDTLSGEDLIVTEQNASIRIEKGNDSFVLDSDAALNLNYVKKMTLNELLLALAMEDLKDLPKDNNNSKSTAIYGSESVDKNNFVDEIRIKMGSKRLNGAKQLAKRGYKESAILATKETFRKYPETKLNIESRLFLIDLLYGMEIYDECMTEINDLKKQNLDEKQSKRLNKLYTDISSRISK